MTSTISTCAHCGSEPWADYVGIGQADVFKIFCEACGPHRSMGIEVESYFKPDCISTWNSMQQSIHRQKSRG